MYWFSHENIIWKHFCQYFRSAFSFLGRDDAQHKCKVINSIFVFIEDILYFFVIRSLHFRLSSTQTWQSSCAVSASRHFTLAPMTEDDCSAASNVCLTCSPDSRDFLPFPPPFSSLPSPFFSSVYTSVYSSFGALQFAQGLCWVGWSWPLWEGWPL